MKNSRLFEILYLLVEKRAVTAGELAQLSALFHREGGDWLEVDFTDWGSGAGNLCLGEGGYPGSPTFVLHLLQLRWGRKPSDCGARPSGVQEWVLVSVGLLPNPAGLACLPLGADGGTGLGGGELPTPASPKRLESPSPSEEPGVNLRLRFQPSAAWRVRDYFHPRQITQEPDGRLLVDCNFPADQWLLSFLLSFGSQLEVLSPGDWRDILIQEGKKFLAVYET